MTDRELAEQCLKGSRSAQQILWKRYSASMYAVCRRYFDRDDDARDALQEGFIRVFNYLNQWNEQGPLGAWVRRVMVNNALNMVKSSGRRGMQQPIDSSEEVANWDGGALMQLQAEDLIRLIQEMPEGYRTVFNLFAVEGYSHQEIAAMLEITESTSKTQYHKAKGWLRARLERR
jgi:RNA polymerase sigma factor (sigma-70 family)